MLIFFEYYIRKITVFFSKNLPSAIINRIPNNGETEDEWKINYDDNEENSSNSDKAADVLQSLTSSLSLSRENGSNNLVEREIDIETRLKEYLEAPNTCLESEIEKDNSVISNVENHNKLVLKYAHYFSKVKDIIDISSLKCFELKNAIKFKFNRISNITITPGFKILPLNMIPNFPCSEKYGGRYRGDYDPKQKSILFSCNCEKYDIFYTKEFHTDCVTFNGCVNVDVDEREKYLNVSQSFPGLNLTNYDKQKCKCPKNMIYVPGDISKNTPPECVVQQVTLDTVFNDIRSLYNIDEKYCINPKDNKYPVGNQNNTSKYLLNPCCSLYNEPTSAYEIYLPCTTLTNFCYPYFSTARVSVRYNKNLGKYEWTDNYKYYDGDQPLISVTYIDDGLSYLRTSPPPEVKKPDKINSFSDKLQYLKYRIYDLYKKNPSIALPNSIVLTKYKKSDISLLSPQS